MPETVTFHIPAIDCSGCIDSIRKIVERRGATLEAGDPDTQDVTIAFDPAQISADELAEALSDADYEPAKS